MEMSPRRASAQLSSFSASRRWRISLSVALSIAAASALLVMVNYLALRHFHRFYWTSEPAYRLSPLTVRLLGSLTNEVRVLVFFDQKDPLFRPVEALLKEYKVATPKLKVEYVDYPRDLAAASLAQERYKLGFLSLNPSDLVLFDCGGRTASVVENQLSDYDLSGFLAGTNDIKRTAFKGEQLFNAALLRVTDPRSRKAYFLEGHREHDPGSDEQTEGYSKFAGLLSLSNTQWERLRLRGTNDVPADCDLLIVAGPRDRLLEPELDALDKYLGRGGRLLALVRSMTTNGLDRLLARWNVHVGDNVIVDRQSTVNGLDLLTTNFTAHPVVRNLFKSQLYLYLPRLVESEQGARSTADAARAENLILTGPTAQACTQFQNGLPVASGQDRRGPVPLAVAVEKGGVQGIVTARGATRIIVVGESIFLGNTAIHNYGNYDFAFLAVNWLMDRPQLQGGVGPRPIREYRLVMTRSQRRAVRWLLLAGMPGTILALGVFIWRRRLK